MDKPAEINKQLYSKVVGYNINIQCHFSYMPAMNKRSLKLQAILLLSASPKMKYLYKSNKMCIRLKENYKTN